MNNTPAIKSRANKEFDSIKALLKRFGFDVISISATLDTKSIPHFSFQIVVDAKDIPLTRQTLNLILQNYACNLILRPKA